MNVDDLVQEIRRVDGNHDLGAGALAEALMPFIEKAIKTSDDESYEIGKRDGIEEAVQNIDILTGGNGEYVAVVGGDPDDVDCPDPSTMAAKISRRFLDLEKSRDHWKANHEDMVRRNRVFRERPDLPVDRIPAIKEYDAAIVAAHQNFVSAWESLKGGQNYTLPDITHWIQGRMYEALSFARSEIKRIKGSQS